MSNRLNTVLTKLLVRLGFIKQLHTRLWKKGDVIAKIGTQNKKERRYIYFKSFHLRRVRSAVHVRILDGIFLNDTFIM